MEYKCQYCGLTVKTSQALGSHIYNKHADIRGIADVTTPPIPQEFLKDERISKAAKSLVLERIKKEKEELGGTNKFEELRKKVAKLEEEVKTLNRWVKILEDSLQATWDMALASENDDEHHKFFIRTIINVITSKTGLDRSYLLRTELEKRYGKENKDY